MNTRGKIDNLNEEAWKLRRNEMEKSLLLASTAFDLSVEVEYSKGKHVSLLNKGIQNVYHNNYKEALKQLFTALKYFVHNDMKLHQTRALNTIGMVYIIQGEFTKALMQLNRGLNISRSLDDSEMKVYILYNIAEIYKFSYSLYDKAIPYLVQASEYCNENPHALCGAVLSSLSNCLQHVGNTQEALNYAHLALSKATELDDTISLGLCHEMVCSLKKDLGDYDAAWSHCEKSLKYREILNDEFAKANVWLVMSQICMERENFKDAIIHATKAIDIAHGSKTESILVHLYMVMGKSLYALGDFKESAEYYEKHIKKNNERISAELENRISILTSEMKTRELEKDMEIFRLKNVELKQKHDEIKLINQIGQQITASLELDQIVQLIYESINQLLDAPFLGIGMLNEEEDAIGFIHLKETEIDLPQSIIYMDDERSFAAKCLKSGDMLYIPDVSIVETETIRLGEEQSPKMMVSILYSPLYISKKVIGVLTIQSDKPNAYSEADIEIFRGISNYVAIAINNANQKTLLLKTAQELRSTLKNLKDTQDYLIQTEKFAALGNLIAGVAHEINTPLGTSITLGSFIADEHNSLWSYVEENNLTKSALDNYLAEVQEALNGLDKNLHKTADIVSSFKLVAVDQSTLKMRRFNVHEYINDILRAYRSKYINTSHNIILNCEEGLEIESYPGIFAHIISNLLINSLEHGLKNVENGQIIITFKKQSNQLHMSFCDNGEGIPNEDLELVFDPFYSTSKSSGSIGLGLHVVHNMVTQVLDGSVSIRMVNMVGFV